MDDKTDMNGPLSEWIELNTTNNKQNRRVSQITNEVNFINYESQGHSTIKID
jgi:hypothetical protein